MQLILLGIDDTDNATSRGTGYLARQLSKEIEKCSLGKVSEVSRLTGIDAVIDLNGGVVPSSEKIKTGDWVRPVIRNNRIILIAQKAKKNIYYEWKVATADIIKSISD